MQRPSRRQFIAAGIGVGLGTLTAPAPGATSRASRARPSAIDLVLPNVYDTRIDPALCLVSEKYDGVRAFWDGHTLRHRSGRVVSAPTWFVDALPVQPLDGELWLGRGRFDALSGTVRKALPVDEEWRPVKYMVFELPGAAGPFAERAQAIRACVASTGQPWLHAAPQEPVADGSALQRRLDETVTGGGEGLMLHLASAPYASGRTDALTKLKPFLDAEAVVIDQREGRGKFVGRVGSLQVRTPDGRIFFVGSGLGDETRRSPPPTGTVITYRYRDLTPSGLPRFATYLRVHEAL